MAEDAAATAATTDATTSTTTDTAAADAGKTFTQEQVNDLIAREKGKFQSKYGDYDDLKTKAAQFDEQQAANATDLEKAQSKLATAEQKKAEAETKLLRYEVATEKKVPPQLVPLLTATSKEDLEAQADLIIENAKSEPTPEFDGGVREPAAEPKTPEQGHNDFLLNVLGVSPK